MRGVHLVFSRAEASGAFAVLDGVAGHVHLAEDAEVVPQAMAGEVCAVVYDNTDMEQRERARDWLAQAGDCVQLTAHLRAMSVTWRWSAGVGRVLIHGPDDLVDQALHAVAQFMLLNRAMADLRTEIEDLKTHLAMVQGTAELARHAEDLRALFNRATQARFAALRLLTYFETPARTAPAGPALRLRTELTVQALMEDALDHALQELDVLQSTYQAELERTQEQKRGRLEKIIGLTIIVILVVEGGLILYDSILYDLIYGTLPPLP